MALKGAISSGAGFISAVLPEIVAESIWQVAPEVVLKETMQSSQNGNASLFSALKNIDLPPLPKNSNKYKRGRTLLIAGSKKYPGAAYLALKGAISSGAGFISAVLPETVAESIWQVAPEIVLKETMQSNKNGNASLFLSLIHISEPTRPY